MLIGFAATVTEVHCNNCGADWWTKASAIGTLVGLAFAGAAFLIALRANNTAKNGLQIAQEQHKMTKTEHEEFLREIRARPDLAVSLDVREVEATYENGRRVARVESDATAVWVHLVLGLRNAGSAPLRDPALNLLIPQSIGAFRRVGHDGSAHPEGRPPDTSSQERLRDAQGNLTEPVQFLMIRMASIPADGGAYQCYASFLVNVPDVGETSVPVVLKVMSADLSHNEQGVHEVATDLMVVVRRPRRSDVAITPGATPPGP